jgi:hypothetical protein
MAVRVRRGELRSRLNHDLNHGIDWASAFTECPAMSAWSFVVRPTAITCAG